MAYKYIKLRMDSDLENFWVLWSSFRLKGFDGENTWERETGPSEEKTPFWERFIIIPHYNILGE